MEERSLIRNNTQVVLNSTQLSGAMARETITISSVASPEPKIDTIDSDSKEPTFPYRFGNQHPFLPPSLIDLNLAPNPFKVVATIRQDKEYSPESPEPSDPSPISTPQWNWAPFKAGRHRIQPQMTIRFFLRMSIDGYFGILLLTKPLTPMSPDKNLPPRIRPPHCSFHQIKRESWKWGCLFLKKGVCRSTHARYAASPYQ